MRDPIVNQQRYARVVDQVQSLLRRRIGGHDDYWSWIKGSGGEVGVVHEGDMGEEVIACCEMKLWIRSAL